MTFWEKNKQIIINIVVAFVTALTTVILTPIVSNYFSQDPKVKLGIPNYYLNCSSYGYNQLPANNDTINIITLIEIDKCDILGNFRYNALPLPFQLYVDEIRFIDHLSYLVFATPQGELHTYHIGDKSDNPRFVENNDSTITRIQYLAGENESITIAKRPLSKYLYIVDNKNFCSNEMIDELMFCVVVYQDRNKVRTYFIRNKIFATNNVDDYELTNSGVRFCINHFNDDNKTYILKAKRIDKAFVKRDNTNEFYVIHDYKNTIPPEQYSFPVFDFSFYKIPLLLFAGIIAIYLCYLIIKDLFILIKNKRSKKHITKKRMIIFAIKIIIFIILITIIANSFGNLYNHYRLIEISNYSA